MATTRFVRQSGNAMARRPSWRMCWPCFFSRVHATLHPALSVGQSVGRSVTLYFLYDFYFWTSLLVPKWSCDLKYGPCPPARDFGSRVSRLVLIFFNFFFLVADTQLYKRICPSVSPSVGPLVRLPVCPSGSTSQKVDRRVF